MHEKESKIEVSFIVTSAGLGARVFACACALSCKLANRLLGCTSRHGPDHCGTVSARQHGCNVASLGLSFFGYDDEAGFASRVKRRVCVLLCEIASADCD